MSPIKDNFTLRDKFLNVTGIFRSKRIPDYKTAEAKLRNLLNKKNRNQVEQNRNQGYLYFYYFKILTRINLLRMFYSD